VSKLSEIVESSWPAVYEEVRQTSINILKEAGQDAYEEMKPFVENIARWSADYTLALAQDEPGAEEARKMIIHQLEMIAMHLSHEARKSFYAMIEKDLLILARVLGTILKAAIA
jgi:hypothetical protein